MNKFFYYKITFLSISAGMIVYGIFDIDFLNNEGITKLLLKSLIPSTGTGLILGILKMLFKISNFQRKKN